MAETKRIVISQSKKRKNGIFTDQVVYHSKDGRGITRSQTKHEARRKNG